MFWSTPEAKEHLVGIMKQSLKEVAWPLQALVVLMHLIGKKLGGCRTIALMSSFARLVMAHLSDSVRQWDVNVADVADTAVRGRNAQLCVSARHMQLELDRLEGLFSVLILWDGQKFFDRLKAMPTTNNARSAGFPIVPLALGMQQHRSPRLLTSDG